MKKTFFLLILSFVFAEQFSGLLINELDGQPLKDYELTINKQKVTADTKGYYQAEIKQAQPNHYLLKLKNINKHLFITNHNRLNVQMSAGIKKQPKASKLFSEIKIVVLDNATPIDRADVMIYAVSDDFRNYSLWREVHDYNHGTAVYKYIQSTEAMYVAVSRNNMLYVQKLENIVPGKIQDINIELSDFKEVFDLAGAAYKNRKGFTEILYLPPAKKYYIADNIIPVRVKQLGEYTLLGFGQEVKLPESLNYYNLREFIYRTPDGLLTIYTDLKIETPDLSAYGNCQLLSYKGYHVAGLDFSNFSISLLKDVREQFVLQVEKKKIKESDDNEND